MEESPATQPEKPTVYERLAALRKRLVLYRVITVFLVLSIALILFANWQLVKTGILEVERPFISYDKTAPYLKEIKGIIEPLRYSAVPILLERDVTIDLDFDRKKWTMHNVYRFDKDGKVLLVEGRYGLCGELAAYTYDKIKPLFGDRYSIEFVRAAESGYFLTPKSSHIVLLVTDRSPLNRQIYVIDPSFRRYGRLELFEDYMFFSKSESLEIIKRQDRDAVFEINNLIPLIVKKGFLLGMVVEDINGAFDRDNFVLAITANRRHRFAGRYVFALRKNMGKQELYEDKEAIKGVLSKEEYETLKKRLAELFEQISYGDV